MRYRSGFTLVELLIVIVIIAILASITAVAYNGIQNKANDSAVKSDLDKFSRSIELYAVTNGSYPLPANLTALGSKPSKPSYKTTSGVNNLIYCVALDQSSYGLAVVSLSGNIYEYDSIKNSISAYTPTWTSSGSTTCPNLIGASYTWTWGYTNGAWQGWIS